MCPCTRIPAFADIPGTSDLWTTTGDLVRAEPGHVLAYLPDVALLGDEDAPSVHTALTDLALPTNLPSRLAEGPEPG